MKRLIVCIGLLVLSTAVYAQKIEVEASYGTPSIYGITETIMGTFVAALSTSEYETSSNGVLNIGVTRYNQNMKWRYGGEFGVEFFTTRKSLNSLQYYSISPKIDYFYSPMEHKFRFYSGISAGIVFRSGEYYDSDKEKKNTENNTILGFNITPIGVRYGEDIGVFLDTNLGNKGFFQLGVNYVF